MSTNQQYYPVQSIRKTVRGVQNISGLSISEGCQSGTLKYGLSLKKDNMR